MIDFLFMLWQIARKKNLQTIEIIYIYKKTEYNKRLTKVKQSKIFFLSMLKMWRG